MCPKISTLKSGLNSLLIATLLLSGCMGAKAQTLRLDSCWSMAIRQYPQAKTRDLISRTRDYNIQNAMRGYLPQFMLTGQATYQSAVTTVSLPAAFKGFSFPAPNKDQFNVHAELDETIYDGGAIKNQKLNEQSNAVMQESNLEVNLYALKDRVSQVYFGVLLLNEQLKQNAITRKDIQNSIDKAKANVLNGIAIKSSVYELEASLLQQEQNRVGLAANRQAYVDMLGVFIGKNLDTTVSLIEPEMLNPSSLVNRPELKYYEAQKKLFDVQDKMLTTNVLPKFLFYVQGGVANPGLNAFDNTAQPYYIGGLRLSWALGGFYTLKNQRQVLNINRQTIDIQKETFLYNTLVNLKQENTEINRLRTTLSKDDELIIKRVEVKEAAKAQLASGIITVHEYINQLDAEDQARQNQVLHKLQLLLALYNYQNTSGN